MSFGMWDSITNVTGIHITHNQACCERFEMAGYQEYPSHSMSATPKLGRLRLQVLVEPSEDGLVPQPAVLRLQHPVAFVRKIEQFGGHAAALERGEDLERLAVRHTIVQVALDDQHRRIQFLDEV